MVNFIMLVGMLIILIFFANIKKAWADYGIITTLKGNLAGSGEVLSVFNHARGVYYVGYNIFQVRLINSTNKEDMAVVGTGACCYGGDGDPALSATMHWSHDVYVTASGEIYFTEPESRRIRLVSSSGYISTVAGTGNQGYSATPTLAINADLWHPIGLVLDADENIFFSDYCVIRKITRSTGVISTIAGSSANDCAFSGDGGLAVNAKIYLVHYVDLDSDDNIIFAEYHSQVVRKITRQTGIIATIISGIGCRPVGISVDRSTNNVYFSDICKRVFRSSKKYNSDSYGTFELVAGGNGGGYSGDGGDANSAQIDTEQNIEFDSLSPNGAFLIADRYNHAIRVVTNPRDDVGSAFLIADRLNHAIRLVSNPCDDVGSELFGSDCWCSKGYYSDTGRAPCNQCDYGSYSDVIGGKLSDCKCQNGFYSSAGYAPCMACPEGTDSKIPIGATSCTCKVGYIGQGDEVPSTILVGTASFRVQSYVDLNNFYSTHSFSAPCNACPVNSGTWNALISPTSLQEGQGNKCLCDPNTKSATGFGPCESCAEGSGSLRLSRRCEYGIKLELFNVQSYQMTKCYCKSGYYSPDGTDSGGNCITCPQGKISINKDLIFLVGDLDTFRGYPHYCYQHHSQYGLGDSPLNSKCVCIRNYYKNPSVTIAPSGHLESSNDCIQCDEGSATTGYDGTSCTICDIGYYSPTGLAPCAKCADGKTTNGYQRTSCTVTSTFAPTLAPTADPTPSSPSITNPPIALPTKAPLQTKRPTAPPTMRPSQPNQCSPGYFSSTGFTPNCLPCSLGTTTSGPGMSSCDICAAGYYGSNGEPPCTACPASYTTNDDRTACLHCIGYLPGCSTTGNNGIDGSNDSVLMSNITARLALIEKKIKAQQGYMERYKRQRQGEL